MGWWQISADALAGSRRAWLGTHMPAYRERLANDPVTALLIRTALGKEWIADFLTPHHPVTPRQNGWFHSEALNLPDVGARQNIREKVAEALRAALVAGEMRPGVIYPARYWPSDSEFWHAGTRGHARPGQGRPDHVRP